ncbi:cystatin-like [Neoarius graeffei]|uniref:cystatin-like n=1 Tax=Neoarius graeffei TaxID=443677 RepID=UPI00298BD5BA|nr:cystatin-like [Neoarius graeffei]
MFLKVVAPLVVVFLAVESGGLLGAPEDVDSNREDVQHALQFAVNSHNKKTNDLFVAQVVSVRKAQIQVVSGLNYIFTVELVRTSCRKGGVQEVCVPHPDPTIANPQVCNLKVWSQPWMNSMKVTENTCQ